jgi:ABC-type lipoprotein export system ATPase subunit
MLYQVEDLHFSYLWNKQEQPVLKGLSFKIEKSSFTCMVGPSGTGKTTLLNLLGLIDSAKSGKIIFDGEDVTSISENVREGIRLHKVGFVFQSFYLIPTLTVLENTIYFLPSIGYSSGWSATACSDCACAGEKATGGAG